MRLTKLNQKYLGFSSYKVNHNDSRVLKENISFQRDKSN